LSKAIMLTTSADRTSPVISQDRSVPRSRVNSGDASIDRRGRVRDVPAILSYGFRPFFLLASIHAALSVPIWLIMFLGGFEPAGALHGLTWHSHEMIFGYLSAVMAGFILTAVPNWTGRLPLSGARLAALVGLWLAGRLAVAFDPEPVSAAALDLAFPLLLAAAVWREIVAGRNFGNAPIAAMLTLFALANALDHAAGLFPALHGIGTRLGLGVAAMLIALVGGRVTPSFTRNWMARMGLSPLPAPMDALDRAALLLTAGAIVSWIAAPGFLVTGALLALAGIFLFARLVRWRGYHAFGEPIVLVLHLGYLWLATALVLLGLSAVTGDAIVASSAIHALTAGAVGAMTLAIMTRASRGHTGRRVVADRPTIAIYALVSLGALLRTAAPYADGLYVPVLVAGGVLWSAAFAMFALVYGPMLLRPRASA
jgi:uncharacterized protein involved in response to NO